MKTILAKLSRPALKKEAKNYLLIAGGGTLVIILFFLIYQGYMAREQSAKPKSKSALMTDIPDADENALHGDKRKAYEEDDMRIDVGKGTQNLGDLFPEISTEKQPELSPMPVSEQTSYSKKRNETYQKTQSNIERSIDELNNTVSKSQHVEHPVVNQSAGLSDEDIIRIKQEEARRQAMEQFDAMMQKYMPQPAQPPAQEENPNGKDYQTQTAFTAVSPIAAEKSNVSSGLRYRHRNGFYGVSEVGAQKNTIKASVYGKHVIQSGQFVRIRMDEPMQIGKTILPSGSLITGKATIGEDRLFITIHSIEHNDVIYAVDLDVYDTDGMPGLHLPGSMEMEAAREIGTDVADALSTSTTNSAIFQTQPTAAEQLKTDVGRGLIQGTFRYVGRKLQIIKVTVQDKHKVYLLPK